MRIVVALGGNALLRRGERLGAEIQQANIDRAVTALAALAQENDLVITYGNESQIDLLAVESAADPALTVPYPLDVLGAQTQGMIGSLLVRALMAPRSCAPPCRTAPAPRTGGPGPRWRIRHLRCHCARCSRPG